MKPMEKGSIFKQIINLGITDDMTATDAKNVRVANITAIIAWGMLLFWVPVNIWNGQILIALQNLSIAFAYLLVLPFNRNYHHLIAVSLLLIVGHVQLIFALLVFGTPSGSHFFYPILLIGPYILFRRRYRRMAHLFAPIAGLSMIWFIAFKDNYPTKVFLMDPRYHAPINATIALGGLLLMVAAFMSSVDQTEDALDRARARADALLLNVLPPSIAERLKATPDETIADRHSQATILFADIVGFTPLSSRLSPIKTVELLNDLFTAFDEICDRAGVEKIRTIGDGYMAVCGAPNQCADHAKVLTQVAIEMRDYMATRPPADPLQVRIGLNSGEVVAGIVGISRFHYDVWGDAVNVAARMESLGEPGRIHIARPTWERIHNRFPCEYRGWIQVKGKGDMETWFVK